MNNKFLRQLIKEIQDENTSIAEDAVLSAEYTGFIDTGSYILNAQLSGSLYGGLPNTKMLMLAGKESVGKTFFALSIVKYFLDSNPDAFVMWYLAEPAVTRKMLLDRHIDPSRVIFAEPLTVLEWRFHVVKTLDTYMATKDVPPMIMVLDSLGSLSTEKEIKDTTEQRDSRDMTKQQHIRGTMRIIDKKLAKAKVPMIVTNHVYDIIGAYVPMKEISGGGGTKYSADLTAMLSASKDKTGTEVTGNIIKVNMLKNRIAKQHTVTEVLLSYETGLHRYYGLIELGEKYGIITKEGNKYRFPDIGNVGGHAGFAKTIYKNPDDYFTKEVMELLEAASRTEYCYGQKDITADEDTVEENAEA